MRPNHRKDDFHFNEYLLIMSWKQLLHFLNVDWKVGKRACVAYSPYIMRLASQWFAQFHCVGVDLYRCCARSAIHLGVGRRSFSRGFAIDYWYAMKHCYVESIELHVAGSILIVLVRS